MTTQLAPFPNVKLALIALLGDLARAGTESPAPPWNGDPTFLRIRVYGGTDDRITDRPRFDVDALADDEQVADDLAESVRQRLLAGPHEIDVPVGEGTVRIILDRVRTDTRPHQVPWGANTAVFNATAAYQGSLRR